MSRARDHCPTDLPLIEKTYEFNEELCRCPTCQQPRTKIGTEITYTIEHLPASFVRIKHVQYKYACATCEHDGHNPQITLAAKTQASPIDKRLPGPGLWIYLGDDAHPYNVFDFTVGRARDGPAQFLKDFRQTLLADAYGGYDGIVVNQDLARAGCWAHARRKFVEVEPAGPQVARTILRFTQNLFEFERRGGGLAPDERLRLWEAESVPLLEKLRTVLVEQKATLLPKHPLAQAIGYTLNQWAELTLFTRDGEVPLHNKLAEQQMKRIALLRKNALFVATPRGGETAAILSSLTSACRRHGINPQVYLTQLLTNLRTRRFSQLDQWLPDQWQQSRSSTPDTTTPPAN